MNNFYPFKVGEKWELWFVDGGNNVYTIKEIKGDKESDEWLKVEEGSSVGGPTTSWIKASSIIRATQK